MDYYRFGPIHYENQESITKRSSSISDADAIAFLLNQADSSSSNKSERMDNRFLLVKCSFFSFTIRYTIFISI